MCIAFLSMCVIFHWYWWTIFSLTVGSVTLGLIGQSLHIRKTAAVLLLWIFGILSNKVPDPLDDDENDTDSSSVDTFLIERDASQKVFRKLSEAPVYNRIFTVLDDSLDFLKAGVESIIEDEVTCRFSNEELKVWNLLARTGSGWRHQNWKLTVLWFVGFVLRYFVFFPIRLIIFVVGLIILVTTTAIAGYIKNDKLRRVVNWHCSLMSYRIISRALSIVATYHNRENMAKPGGICVANHTSPMDVQVLSMDNCYALVGQKHKGVLGFIQNCLSRATDHIWFERAETNDRLAVRRRLQEHVDKQTAMPILIFPEGTCINNTSVMMFKKGSFEMEGATIYPLAMKYDARFGDAFWNSSKQSYLRYMLMLMTSWATVVNVWYLPPTQREPDENGMQFASRVKHLIASAGGLTELEWDGQLKRCPVKQEALENQRRRWGQRVARAKSIIPKDFEF